MFGIDPAQIKATGEQVIAFVQFARKNITTLGTNQAVLNKKFDEMNAKLDRFLLLAGDPVNQSIRRDNLITLEQEPDDARINAGGI